MPEESTLELLMRRYNITGIYADFTSIDDAFDQMNLHIKELKERIAELEKVLASCEQNTPVKKKLIAVERGEWAVKECTCTCGKDNIRSHFHSKSCKCRIKGE